MTPVQVLLLMSMLMSTASFVMGPLGRVVHQTSRLSSFSRDLEAKEIEKLVQDDSISAVVERLATLQPGDDISEQDFQFVATKAIMALGAHGAYEKTKDIMELLEQCTSRGPDVRAFTAAMTVQIRANQFEEAWDTFEAMQERAHLQLDEVAYVCGARAAGFVLPWEAVMDLAVDALVDVGGEAALSVAHTAMTNLKYLAVNGREERQEVLEQVWEMFHWLQTEKLTITTQTTDIVLSVASTHGDALEVEKVLLEMGQLGFKPTQVTFNTLLDRCTKNGGTSMALALMETLTDHCLSPDATTFNSMLKLSVRNKDVQGAREVIGKMKEAGVVPDEYTHALMLQALALDNDVDGAVALLEDAPESALGPHAYSVAIGASGSWRVATKLLQQAVKRNQVDQGVFVAAAQTCLRSGEVRRANAVAQAMLARGFAVNKYSLSFLVSLGLESDHTQLERYLHWVARTAPRLITKAVCQRVMSELAARKDWVTAVRLHVGVFAHTTCKTDTLSEIFRLIQASIDAVGPKDAQPGEPCHAADAAVALLQLYVQEANSTAGGFRRHLLRTGHFNSVLSVLARSGRPAMARDIFHFMSTSPSRRRPPPPPPPSSSSSSSSSSRDKEWVFKPSTFTVAELVRCAKTLEAPLASEMIADVIAWGALHRTYIPLGVVSDAVSSAYDSGDMLGAQRIYDILHGQQQVEHWADKGGHVLDLHDFSRAMAHCAVCSAVREMTESADVGAALTVITGKSSSKCKNESGKTPRLTEDEMNQGRLSLFVQEILVNNFYPPISSMTVVNNPGRLVIPPGEIKRSRSVVCDN